MLNHCIDERLSRKLKNMAFVCALLVVCQHTPVAKWCNEHLFVLIRIAVPFFFCASGYFVVSHMGEKGWYRSAILKRIQTLLVPYLIVLVTWYGIKVLFDGGSIKGLVIAVGGSPVHLPIIGSLWYIRTLFIYMLAIPLLLPLLMGSLRRALVTLVALALLSMMANYIAFTTENNLVMTFLRFGGSAMGLFWFSFGIFLRRNITLQVPALCQILWIGAGVAVGWYLFSPPILGSILGSIFYPVSTSFVMGACFYLMPDGKWPKLMVANVFPLYLMHWQVSYCLTHLCKMSSAGWRLASFLIVVTACLLLAEAVRMCMPKVARIIFGRR